MTPCCRIISYYTFLPFRFEGRVRESGPTTAVAPERPRRRASARARVQVPAGAIAERKPSGAELVVVIVFTPSWPTADGADSTASVDGLPPDRPVRT